MKKLAIIFIVVVAFSCKKKEPSLNCYICHSADSTDAWNGYTMCDWTDAQKTTFELLKTKKGDTTKCKTFEQL